MNQKTIAYLKRRTAELAIGSSTLRNQGAAGVVKVTRQFLANLDLKSFSVNSVQEFNKALDQSTEDLIQALPEGARNWGTARKALNIFLRDCIYNQFLSSHFVISQIHPWLEIPLDNHVASGLRMTSHKKNLPRWVSIKKLKRKDSDKYQDVAAKVADKIECNRVDLDIYLWRQVGIREIQNL